MVMFRYGQLTDYFNYELLYNKPDEWDAWRDPLFFILTEMFKVLGMNYEMFVIVFGLITMWLSYPFFYKICGRSMMALFIYYCYVFLIMQMNAVRQGACISLILCSFVLLTEKRMRLFYTIIILGCFLHISMLSALLIGWLYNKQFYNRSYMKWFVWGLTLFAFITPDLTMYIPAFLNDRSHGVFGEAKFLQVAIRALLIIPVMYVKPQLGSNGYYAKSICITGYCLYCLLSFSPLISARIEYYYRVFLCLFVSYLIFHMKKVYMGSLFLFMILFIHVVLYFKNIDTFISTGDYNERVVSIYNFPYISIFDKEELNHYVYFGADSATSDNNP